MAKHGNGIMQNNSYHIFDSDILKFVNQNSKVFQEEFLNETFRQHRQIMKLLPTDDLLNKNAIDLLSPYGLRKKLMTFYQRPFNFNKKAHTDINADNSYHWYSLNIIVSGQGKMVWFNPSPKRDILHHKNDPKGILYVDFDDYSVLGDPIDVWGEGRIALVKTGIPHHTHNDGPTERLVISIRWDPIITWNSAIELIENFIRRH